jgi:hypothetical protein
MPLPVPVKYIKINATTTASSVPPGSSPALQFKTTSFSAGTILPAYEVKTATVSGVIVKYYKIGISDSTKVPPLAYWYIKQGNTFSEYSPSDKSVGRPVPPPAESTPGRQDIVLSRTIAPSPTFFGIIVIIAALLGIGTLYFWNKKRTGR